MPGKAKSKGIRDAMPGIMNAMGDSIERSNKLDFGLPGVHTQNAFNQPHEAALTGIIWVLLVDDLPEGEYSSPSNARAIILVANDSIGEKSLSDGTEEIVVWNYSGSFAASSGDAIVVVPFNKAYVAISGGGSATSGVGIIGFQLTSADCDLGTADGTVIAVPCTNSTGLSIGSEVALIDFMGCFLTGSSAAMIGLKGYATKMTDGDDRGDSQYEYHDGCHWHIFSLCCAGEVC